MRLTGRNCQRNEFDVPERYRELLRLLGAERLLKLCGEFGGEWLYIPQIKTIERERRRAEVFRRLSGGESVSEIAGILGVSEFTVYSDLRAVSQRSAGAGEPERKEDGGGNGEEKAASGRARTLPGQLSLFD